MQNFTPLTSRERVQRALEHRDHDRVPRGEGFWIDTIRRWQAEGLQGDAQAAYDLLDADIAGCTWCWPAPFTGQAQVLSEDAETRTELDTFGTVCRYWKNRTGTPEHLGFTCKDPVVWRDKFLPGFRSKKIHLDLDGSLKTARRQHARDKFLVFEGADPFEMLRRLLGDEGMALAFYDEPEWVQEICQVTVEMILSDYQALLDAGAEPDAIWTYGDLAYTQSTFCSPAMYRERIWPWHVKMVDWAHERGLKYIYHTDGDIRSLMEHLIDTGCDALQPLECKANMDLRELVPVYGDRVAFFGNVDARVLSTNDPARIEAEIAAKLAAGKSKRGYIYHSDHSIPSDVSFDTFRAMIPMIERHGKF